MSGSSSFFLQFVLRTDPHASVNLDRAVVLFREMLVKHCRIINKRDTVQPSSYPLIPLKARPTEASNVSSNYIASEIIFSRRRAPIRLPFRLCKRESDRSSRWHCIELPFTLDLGELLSAKLRVTRIQQQCGRDFGVCAKLTRYTRVSLISFPRTKLSPWRRQWGESLTSQAQTLEMTNDRMYPKYTAALPRGVLFSSLLFDVRVFLPYPFSAVAQSQHF